MVSNAAMSRPNRFMRRECNRGNAFDKRARVPLAWPAMRTSWILLSVLAGNVGAADLPSKTDISLLKEVDRARERGIARSRIAGRTAD